MEVTFNTGRVEIPGCKPFIIKGHLPLLLSDGNPDVELDLVKVKRLSHQVATWFVEQNLVDGGYKVAFKYAEKDFVPGTSFLIPDLYSWEPEKARLVTIAFMWIVIVDDLFDDETSILQTDKKVTNRSQLDKLRRIVSDLWFGRIKAEEIVDLGRTLQSVGKSIEALGRETALVVSNLEENSKYVLKGIDDFFNHLLYYGGTTSTIPSVSTYLYCKFHITGVQIFHEYHMLIREIVVPRPIRKHRFFKRIMRAITDLVGLSNDLLSLKKEVERGEPLNLIWMKVDDGYSPEEACEHVTRNLLDLTEELKKHRELILAEFPKDFHLEEFLRSFFQAQDGHWQLFSKMPRYLDVSIQYGYSTQQEGQRSKGGRNQNKS